MAILNKGQNFSDGGQVTSEKLNTAVDGATFASGAVDDVSTQLSGGAIIVKDGGVGTAKIADSNVTTAKIADSNITTAKIADSNITTAKIAESNITTAKIADSNVTTAKIADSNITTAKIADDAVTPAKLSAGAPTWATDGTVGIGTNQTSSFGGTTNKINVEYNTTLGYHIKFNDTRNDGLAGAGAIHFLRSGTGVGSITTTTNSTAYNTSSDYRLKEDVIEMEGSLDRLKGLKPCNFRWKSDGTRVDGFLAHEAQEIVPDAVTGTKDAVDGEGNPEYQGIDQSKLVPLLTKALQEAVAKIESLEERVAALES